MTTQNLWSVDISNNDRSESLVTGQAFYAWSLVRAGDTWMNTGTWNPATKTCVNVTKWVDRSYDAIWYSVTFDDGTSADCNENMGFGTWRVKTKVVA